MQLIAQILEALLHEIHYPPGRMGVGVGPVDIPAAYPRSLNRVKGVEAKGKAIYNRLPSTTKASLRDAMTRKMVIDTYSPRSIYDLAIHALEVYAYTQAEGRDGNWDEFLKFTGLSQLQMDQIAMAALDAGWDPYKSTWL